VRARAHARVCRACCVRVYACVYVCARTCMCVRVHICAVRVHICAVRVHICAVRVYVSMCMRVCECVHALTCAKRAQQIIPLARREDTSGRAANSKYNYSKYNWRGIHDFQQI